MPNSSVVDKLVRAAAAIPADIPDDELDRHVADILAKEAKEKESKWRELGIGVYLDDSTGLSSRAPKPNTRFLKSLVRDVDGHNTALLREQANAARAAAADKFYRDPAIRPERDGRRGTSNDARPSRGQDSDAARMRRLFGGALGSATTSRKGEGSLSRYSDNLSSRRDAAPNNEDRHRRSSATAQSSGAAGSWRRDAARQSSSRYRDEDEASEDEERGWSRKDEGRRKPRSAMQRAEEEEEEERRRKRSSEKRREEDRERERKRSRSPARERRAPEKESTDAAPPDVFPSVGSAIPSKMDRYFEPTYDPKKDYRAMLDAQDVAVPRTGLVPDVDIGWDSMLSTIKYRGQEKERARERAWEKEKADERDRRERDVDRSRSKKPSREKRPSTKKRSRREDRSPSVISIPDSSDEYSSDNDSQSRSDSCSSDSSERHRRRKHKHGSSSKRESKKSGFFKRSKSGKSASKRRYDSDDSERERERRKVVVGGYEYVSKGATREWDRGK